MSEATKCDRCGEYIDKSVNDMPRILYTKRIVSERHQISLCHDCYNKFLNEFVNGGPDKAEEEDKMSNWISVKDKLPEKNGYYICTCRWDPEYDQEFGVDILEYSDKISPTLPEGQKKKIFANGCAFGEMWPDGLDNLMEVTAWMPVPEAYKEDET